MTAELSIPPDHPAFTGHFPGFPLLPGAALLDLVLDAIDRGHSIDLRDWQITTVKFLGVVRPGDALTIEQSVLGERQIRFSVRHAHGIVASGTLSAAPAHPVAPHDG